MRHRRTVLTTGQVAEICQVTPRTVSKWFDSGQLQGYRIPGSQDRRIPVARLDEFMKKHGYPLERLHLLPLQQRILLVMLPPEIEDALLDQLPSPSAWEGQAAHSHFEAGWLMSTFQPTCVIADLDQTGWTREEMSTTFCNEKMATYYPLALVCLGEQIDDSPNATNEGFFEAFRKPFDPDLLVTRLKKHLAKYLDDMEF